MSFTVQKSGSHVVRAALFFLASSAAVCFPFFLGRLLWPQGLVAWADHIFWPATGVNVAALLLLGRRYWPVILLDAIPAWLLMGQRLDLCALGSLANAGEALLAVWIIQQAGPLQGGFERVRSVVALLVASMVAPLVNTLTFPAYLIAIGAMPSADFWKALGNWNLANGAAMLLLVPFLVGLRRSAWSFIRYHWWETTLWLALGIAGGLAAFSAVFSNDGMNFAFLVFPFVIFAAVRFGPKEMSASLCIVMVSVYVALALQAQHVSAAQMPAIIWFVQAFCWVLSATGLVIASLMAERIRAEEATGAEKRRTLEASLREQRARLETLRYQINPHFLFNALNSIRSTVPTEASISREMVTRLADYLRSTLDNSDNDMTTLELEVQSVQQYIAIEKVRFGDDLIAEFELEPSLKETKVPVFLLQPLVENAIRHGLAQSKGRFELKIRAFAAGSAVIIVVANSGVWHEGGHRKGVGLENVRRRLEQLYGERAGLSRESSDGQVRMRIELPADGRLTVS